MEKKTLQLIRFEEGSFSDLGNLAEQLTSLKALASRTPTPVIVEQLQQVLAAGDLYNLFLQLDGDVIVGWCMITVSVFEDRGHLGPIAVQKEGEHTGHGSPLIKFSLDYMWEHYADLRRIDLSNRPSHDLETWYRKYGFVPRTEAEGDPTTVYRAPRP